MSYEGATGWLVGEENGGMAAMFTMMNNARLGVGVQGIGLAEAAYQHALAYAQDRRQGRTAVPGAGTIIDHADVRRMLAEMKAADPCRPRHRADQCRRHRHGARHRSRPTGRRGRRS